MAKSRRITRTDDDSDPPSEVPSGSAARQVDATEADQELEKIALELPQGALATLYKFPDIGAEKEWCGEFSGADFGIPLILDRFGPGRYIAYFRAPDPVRAGKWIGAGTRRYSIAKPMAAPAPTGGGADQKFLSAYAELIQTTTARALEGQQLLQQMQLAVLKSMTERPADSSMELLKAILPAVLARPAAGGLDLTAVLTLADKLASRTSPTTAMKEALDLLEKARELSGDGGDAAPAWVQLAARGLDTIGRAISARPATAELAAPEPSTAPAPAEVAPTAPVTHTPEASLPPTAHAVFRFLAPHMPALLTHAQRDHDPTTYAGVIFDQIATEYLAEVRDYVSRPDFLDLLEANFPALRGAVIEGSTPPVLVWEWFGELRDDLVTRISEALGEPKAPSPPASPGVY